MPAPKGNQYAIGNNGGRPPHYKDPESLGKRIDAYFEYVKGEEATKQVMTFDPVTKISELKSVTYWKREPERPMRTALVLFLGFSSFSALDEYEKRSDEFLVMIQRAKMRVAMNYEQMLTDGRGAARGSIFVLQNMGWGARTEVQYFGKDGKPVDPPSTSVITNVPINATLPNTDKEI